MITRENLDQLNSWLKKNWPSYRAMIEGGSVAAGDPLIEGRSDWEIAIVADEINPEGLASLGEFLKTLPQDDRVELVYRITSKLLSPSNDLHYLTGKFRSKTLFGEDLIERIPFPDKDLVEKAWKDGLIKVLGQIDKYLVNASIWSDEKVRKQFRPIFKNIFMFLQMKAWCEDGEYPVTRQNVVDRYHSEELQKMWNTLHSINETNSQDILDTARLASLYISNNQLSN